MSNLFLFEGFPDRAWTSGAGVVLAENVSEARKLLWDEYVLRESNNGRTVDETSLPYQILQRIVPVVLERPVYYHHGGD